MGVKIIKFIDYIESHLCKFLLSFFVTLLFVQVVFRVVIKESLTWSEELSRFAFVWFAYLGASYAARLGAHNRVSIQFRKMPPFLKNAILLVADSVWIFFNIVMIRESIVVIRDMLEFPFNSPALDLPMHFIYLIFPFAFGLMTVRIIQVNILKYVYGIEMADVDEIETEAEEAELELGDPEMEAK